MKSEYKETNKQVQLLYLMYQYNTDASVKKE